MTAEEREVQRWAEEPAYFRLLHDLLPEPFFHTQGFILFALGVLAAYWLVPRRFTTARVWLLVIASFHFYAAWNARLALLVTLTTAADFLLARWMDRATNPRLRKGLLFTSVGMNLGLLAYFKYRGFFVGELHAALERFGVQPGFSPVVDILVPFGISFYTFEAISYAVDVYRRTIRAETSLPRFLLFILFFPHLVAGPIVRAGDFLPQTRRPKRWNWVRVQIGVQLILLGAFKKLAVADRMAVFADPVFENPAAHGTAAVWLAVLAYALRIYADFSGYSDMALGTAHLFGYTLTRNFNMPYLAANVSEFWRRWHISLSTWLRDYVFIPLGGSRVSAWATDRNLLITMALGGLWHGANWTYVLWGVLHGLLLIGHRRFRAWCEPRPALSSLLRTPLGTAFRVTITFLCVALLWVFFQPDWSRSSALLTQMFGLHDGLPLPLHNRSLWYTVLFVLGCHLLVASGLWQKVWRRTPAEVQGLGYAVCLLAAMLLAPVSGKTFIYFNF